MRSFTVFSNSWLLKISFKMSIQYTFGMMTIITKIIICSRKTFYTDAESVTHRRLSVTHRRHVSDATISEEFSRIKVYPSLEG